MANIWTEDNISQMKLLNQQGFSSSKIGAIIGMPDYAIRKKRKELGIPAGTNSPWSSAELDTLEDLLLEGFTSKDISEFMGRGERSISEKKKLLGLSNSLLIKAWSNAEIATLKELVSMGIGNIEIALLMNRGISSINHKKRALNLSNIRSWYEHIFKGTQEETRSILLEILRNTDNTTAAYFNNPNNMLPNTSTYQRYFGSWNNALIMAGLPINPKGLSPTKDTILYVVKFHDFYKVGITQRSIEVRLKQHPKYTVVTSHIFPYEKACSIEKTCLAAVSTYRYTPNKDKFPSGFTECFSESGLAIVLSILAKPERYCSQGTS